jgi:hypothetical protein
LATVYNPIANVLVPLVARNGPVQLAPDADARGAKTMTRFVLAGGKIDELPSLLASPLFPVKYLEARRWFFVPGPTVVDEEPAR